MFRVVKWTCVAVGKFFRIVYANGLWLPRHLAAEAVHHGWCVAAPSQRLVCLGLRALRNAVEVELASSSA